jgi:hypothetical protein
MEFCAIDFLDIFINMKVFVIYCIKKFQITPKCLSIPCLSYISLMDEKKTWMMINSLNIYMLRLTNCDFENLICNLLMLTLLSTECCVLIMH